ncbi:unnamed protein product [Closterium sp. Yama58-4]|nr:unnamed protein product [Closterium sp. Yama58-4]
MRGVLRRAIPYDACEPLTNPVGTESAEGESAEGAGSAEFAGEAEFVLIERGNCLFDVKVLNAQRAGYAAAVVYNNEPRKRIITMSGRHMWGIAIPAPSPPICVLLPTFDNAAWSVITASLVSLLSLSIVLASFLFIRRHRLRQAVAAAATAMGADGAGRLLAARQEPPGLSEEEVKALPELVFPPKGKHASNVDDAAAAAMGAEGGGGKGGEGGEGREGGEGGEGGEGTEGAVEAEGGGGEGREMKTCAICLEDYEWGDRLRLLPCSHEFHVDCVDQWLTTRRPFCPVCKRDAHPPTHLLPSSPPPLTSPSSSSTTATTALTSSSPVAASTAHFVSFLLYPLIRSFSPLPSLPTASNSSTSTASSSSLSPPDPSREPFLLHHPSRDSDDEETGEIIPVPIPGFTPPSPMPAH